MMSPRPFHPFVNSLLRESSSLNFIVFFGRSIDLSNQRPLLCCFNLPGHFSVLQNAMLVAMIFSSEIGDGIGQAGSSFQTRGFGWSCSHGCGCRLISDVQQQELLETLVMLFSKFHLPDSLVFTLFLSVSQGHKSSVACPSEYLSARMLIQS